MTILQSILLGIVQGLTEFLPVSSSAHLVIVPYLLNWHIPETDAFVFDVLVQVATLLGVFAYFWKDLLQIATAVIKGIFQRQPFKDPAARQGWYILLASIPAGVFGLLIKDAVEAAFASPAITAAFLLVTAALLVTAERIGSRKRRQADMTWQDALWIGIFQALAIFPGISRSGSTIVGGMTRQFDRPTAARFSFLMSIPIMLAAGLLATLDMLAIPNFASLLPAFIPGFVVAAITGYLSIRWLLGFLTRRPLYGFSIYCCILSILTLAVFWLR
jgi:undecaprenyl-diphosphatase